MVEPDPRDPPTPDEIQRRAAEELAKTTRLVSKLIQIMVGLTAIAILVFWIGWVRAPSPEAICQHKVDLVFGTVGEDQREGAEALVGQLEVKCVDAANKKIQMRGKLVYADYAKCVMAATTLDQAERC